MKSKVAEGLEAKPNQPTVKKWRTIKVSPEIDLAILNRIDEVVKQINKERGR